MSAIEIILEAAGEAEHRLGRRLAVGAEQRGRAAPANFDAAEQIGLRAGHLEYARGIELRGRAEYLRVRQEANLGAAPIGGLADDLQLGDGLAALEALAIQRLRARHLDLGPRGKRIDDGDADAVQAARGLVGAAVELAARVQLGHDDLERGFAREFRMRIDRHAAAVVGHGEPAALLHHHLDEGRVARDRLVHRVVDHFGEQMMQRVGVGAADIHARPAPHRLQPLQHLDRRRVVIALPGRPRARGGLALDGRNFTGRRVAAKQVVGHAGLGSDSFGSSLAQPVVNE